MQAKAKFDWDISLIELGASASLHYLVADYPRMIKEINHQEWKRFFINYAQELKKEVFM